MELRNNGFVFFYIYHRKRWGQKVYDMKVTILNILLFFKDEKTCVRNVDKYILLMKAIHFFCFYIN